MVSLKKLAVITGMCTVCHGFLAIGLALGCVVIPLRTFGLLEKRKEEEVKVKMFVHEASKGADGGRGAAPRDTVLLVHGFPDNEKLWDKAVKALTEQGYRCLVAALPGSNGEAVPRALSFDEVAALLKKGVEDVTDQAVTVVAHDWGSVYSRVMQAKYPSLCKRMILVDVGGMKMDSDLHWSTWYAIFSYQVVFALGYWLGDPFGTWLMRSQTRFLFNAFRNAARPLDEMTSDMGYHYATMMKMVVNRELMSGDTEMLDASVPHLFVYGAKKPFPFHDSDWLDFVRSTPCGEVAPLACGHWVMDDEPEALHKIMLEWLDKSWSHQG